MAEVLDVLMCEGRLIGLDLVREYDFFVRGGGVMFLEADGPGIDIGEGERLPLTFPVSVDETLLEV